MEEKIESEQSSMIKQLACCDTKTRGKAIKSVCSWFPLQTEISETDLKKIWKGLFYCVWHADKMQFQSDLIEKLSSLLSRLHPHISEQYFSSFLLTMMREWSGIDALRLDKFYLMIRRFLQHVFTLLDQNAWDLEMMKKFMSIIENRVLSPEDNFVTNGVSYHIASVFMEELKSFLPLEANVFDVLLQPFLSTMERSMDRVLVSKIRCDILETFIKSGKDLLKKSGGEVDGSSEVSGVVLAMNFSSKLYNLGCSANCVQANRKILFELHEEFLKLEKELEKAVRSTKSGKKRRKRSKGKKVGGEGSHGVIEFDNDAISNLRIQFEKAATEVGLSADESIEEVCVSGNISKMKNVDREVGGKLCENGSAEGAKRVRFSMKNNLVWKPHTPLPPRSLRLPPAAVPRGSALKKGLPPGPVRETPVMKKMKKRKRRFGKKVMPAPGFRHFRKVQSFSI